ncbi:MAG: HK97 gp10 family phage protein [Solirubrobacterales bacterium]
MLSFDEMQKLMKSKFKEIDNIIKEEMEEKADMCVAEIQSRTPVVTGNLRRSMGRSNIKKYSGSYSIKVGSNLEYAKWVEEGHKQTPGRYVPSIGKRLKKSFVQGNFAIRDSVEIYQAELNKSIEKRIGEELFK